jgi:hypothetical protein
MLLVARVESPDLEAAAFDPEAAADTMRPYLERLSGLIMLMDANPFSTRFPPEFHILTDDLFAAHQVGERAFLRHLQVYPQLKDEWISATGQQFRMTFSKGLRDVFTEKIEILNRCSSIARRRAGLAPRTEVPASTYHNYFGEVHMGDVFQGISNATIVSRSKVEGAFNRLQDSGQGESAKLLVEIGKRVSDANNTAAGAVFSQLTEELSKPAHDKGVLKSCWDGLVAILPSLASLSAEVIKAFVI